MKQSSAKRRKRISSVIVEWLWPHIGDGETCRNLRKVAVRLKLYHSLRQDKFWELRRALDLSSLNWRPEMDNNLVWLCEISPKYFNEHGQKLLEKIIRNSDKRKKIFPKDLSSVSPEYMAIVKKQIEKRRVVELRKIVREIYTPYSPYTKQRISRPTLKWQMVDYVYSRLFNVPSSVEKRIIEKENILESKDNQAQVREFFLTLSGILVPLHVFSHVLDFYGDEFGRKELDTFGLVNEQWYLVCLCKIKTLRLTARNFNHIPQLVRSTVSTVSISNLKSNHIMPRDAFTSIAERFTKLTVLCVSLSDETRYGLASYFYGYITSAPERFVMSALRKLIVPCFLQVDKKRTKCMLSGNKKKLKYGIPRTTRVSKEIFPNLNTLHIKSHVYLWSLYFNGLLTLTVHPRCIRLARDSEFSGVHTPSKESRLFGGHLSLNIYWLMLKSKFLLSTILRFCNLEHLELVQAVEKGRRLPVSSDGFPSFNWLRSSKDITKIMKSLGCLKILTLSDMGIPASYCIPPRSIFTNLKVLNVDITISIGIALIPRNLFDRISNYTVSQTIPVHLLDYPMDSVSLNFGITTYAYRHALSEFMCGSRELTAVVAVTLLLDRVVHNRKKLGIFIKTKANYVSLRKQRVVEDYLTWQRDINREVWRQTLKSMFCDIIRKQRH